jgi:hypothetical protein
MDLHKLIDYMKFAGNEAGKPYYYANGGIWPHGNAWYALGLISNGLNNDALNFVKRTMTLYGIINSPNGQPALYEYRISDKTKPAFYGKIDKPQFLWAGGWYFYTIYNLFGLRENEWNIALSPFIPQELDTIRLSVTIKGIPVKIEISGEGNEIASITYNDRQIPSAIVPENINDLNKISLKLGNSISPYLSSANAIVLSPVYNIESRTLEFDLESFEGHLIELKIISPSEIKNIFVNDQNLGDGITEIKNDALYEINVKHIARLSNNHYSIIFR